MDELLWIMCDLFWYNYDWLKFDDTVYSVVPIVFHELLQSWMTCDLDFLISIENNNLLIRIICFYFIYRRLDPYHWKYLMLLFFRLHTTHVFLFAVLLHCVTFHIQRWFHWNTLTNEEHTASNKWEFCCFNCSVGGLFIGIIFQLLVFYRDAHTQSINIIANELVFSLNKNNR